MTEFPLSITLVYLGLNALIMLALGVIVSVARLKTRIDLGDGGNATLLQAIRAHGNNSEYVPIALIMLAALELMAGPPWLLHGLGGALTLGRLLHAQGLYQSSGRSFGRVLGTSLTWLVLAAGGGACLYLGLTL